ncbi:MAG: ribonuclease HII [Bacteroidales bacterium]|nr:ribonuclease HII [Bacteroidales bacterium]
MLKSCFNPLTIEAGIDEAGRGCLAGPVFAAAVILPDDYCNPSLNDSKKLSEKTRNRLRDEIEHVALDWSVVHVGNEKIDILNILRSSILAMHMALDGLRIRPEHIIVDGSYFCPYESVPHHCIIRGDSIYASIAAASVLAKTYRDAYMISLHQDYHQYGWDKNKGYGTTAHRYAIAKYGTTPYHRKSFTLVDKQFTIDF